MIVDSPPLLAVADGVILSAKVQGTVFVLASGNTRLARIEEAITLLRRSTTPILGVVLNKVPRHVDSYYGDRSYEAYMQADPLAGHRNGKAEPRADALPVRR